MATGPIVPAHTSAIGSAPDAVVAALDALNAEVVRVLRYDPASAIPLAAEACKAARALGDPKRLAESMRNLGVSHAVTSMHAEALEVLGTALTLFQEIGDERGSAGTLCWMGRVHGRMSDFGAAMKELLTALQMERSAQNAQGESDCLNSMGNVYFHLGEYDQALEFYQQSLRLREDLGDRDGESECVNNIGNIYGRLGDYSAALDYYSRALTLKRELGFERSEVVALGNLGNTHAALDDFDKALEYFEQALEHARRVSDDVMEANSLHDIGKVYARRVEPQQAVAQFDACIAVAHAAGLRHLEAEALLSRGSAHMDAGETDVGRRDLLEALSIAEEVNVRRLVYEAHRTLSGAYAGLGDHASALRHYERFHEVEEEVFNLQSNRRIQVIMVQAQVERSQREADLLRSANEELTQMNRALELANADKARLLEQLQYQTEELERQTKEDSLTGLFNRRHVDRQLDYEFERARRFRRDFTVAVGDLDNFKSINDRFSHSVGDAVLRQVAAILKDTARAIDVVGRYGGEEFVLLLVETPPENAMLLCDRLRRKIEEHDWSAIHPDLSVTISIGLAGGRAAKPEQLLEQADAKLYEAKRAGRNRCM